MHLMSIDDIMAYIEEMNDCEQAHLVYQITNCNKFELGVMTHDMEFNVSVFTMFDEDASNKYAYFLLTITINKPLIGSYT
jgi:hypothetical protein